ncbi:MAG: hypothetical protein WC655_17215 [Candidatus Hydrogenedentales bacterium]|jgi:hypothetical protein
METPNTKAGAAVERIMELFSRFSEHRKDHVVSLDTATYNRVYGIILRELEALEAMKGGER